MDDNSNSFALSVPIVGVGNIAAGQSAILIEGTATTASTFTTTWFGANPPAGFLIGSYTGSGVGLSATSDAVNLFTASGTLVTGVTFGAATTGVSFDNTAGLTALTTLSAVGGQRRLCRARRHRDRLAGTNPLEADSLTGTPVS